MNITHVKDGFRMNEPQKTHFVCLQAHTVSKEHYIVQPPQKYRQARVRQVSTAKQCIALGLIGSLRCLLFLQTKNRVAYWPALLPNWWVLSEPCGLPCLLNLSVSFHACYTYITQGPVGGESFLILPSAKGQPFLSSMHNNYENSNTRIESFYLAIFHEILHQNSLM